MSRLLVVENEGELREFLALLLRERGYQVELAASRAQARAQWDPTRFDGLIVELMLPDGDAEELLRELGDAGALADRVVVTIATVPPSSESWVAQRFPFLRQPFSMSALERILATLPSRRDHRG